jgi:hypothetical protein
MNSPMKDALLALAHANKTRFIFKLLISTQSQTAVQAAVRHHGVSGVETDLKNVV